MLSNFKLPRGLIIMHSVLAERNDGRRGAGGLEGYKKYKLESLTQRLSGLVCEREAFSGYR